MKGFRVPDVRAIQKQVTDRLSELEKLLGPLQSEYEQLKNIASNLLPGHSEPAPSAAPARRGRRSSAAKAKPTATRTRSRRTASAPRAKRGGSSGGGRADEALRLVTEKPGVTIRELASAMSLSSPNYLYRLLPQLERDGKVSKQGRGYHAKASE
jgi:hypothetical protein